jgi:hypothetical protein
MNNDIVVKAPPTIQTAPGHTPISVQAQAFNSPAPAPQPAIIQAPAYKPAANQMHMPPQQAQRPVAQAAHPQPQHAARQPAPQAQNPVSQPSRQNTHDKPGSPAVAISLAIVLCFCLTAAAVYLALHTTPSHLPV